MSNKQTQDFIEDVQLNEHTTLIVKAVSNIGSSVDSEVHIKFRDSNGETIGNLSIEPDGNSVLISISTDRINEHFSI